VDPMCRVTPVVSTTKPAKVLNLNPVSTLVISAYANFSPP
jgi:hypothetical protein